MVAMPDSPVKLNTPIQTLHLDTPPVVHVDPLPTPHIPALDATIALQTAVTTLQAQNAALAARVAELEKSMVAVRLVLQGVDPAFATVHKKVDDLRAEYAAHGHELPFNFQPFSTLKENGDNNFLMAYVWEGQHQGWTDFQRQQDANQRGASTGKPQPRP